MIRPSARLAFVLALVALPWEAVDRAAATPGVVYVAVARDDHPVAGLSASDFVVKAGGQDEPVLSAEAAKDPISLLIFVQTRPDDTSLTRAALRSMLAQVRQLNPEARVALSNGPATPPFFEATTQAGMLDRTIGALYTEPDLGTIVERVPEFTRHLAEEPSRRRIILAITPPGLTHGRQLTPDTGPDLQKCGCQLWGIEVGQVGGTVIDHDEVYSDLIAQSGGRESTVYGAPLLDAMLRQMASLFLSQYRVTYQHPDSVKPLTLRVGVRGQKGAQVYAPGWTVN